MSNYLIKTDFDIEMSDEFLSNIINNEINLFLLRTARTILILQKDYINITNKTINYCVLYTSGTGYTTQWFLYFTNNKYYYIFKTFLFENNKSYAIWKYKNALLEEINIAL